MKINLIKTFSVALVASMFSFSAFGEIEEDWRVVAYEEFQATDKKLEKVYKLAQKSLLEEWGELVGKEQIKHLTLAQDAWLKWRPLEAEVRAYRVSGGGHIHSGRVSLILTELTNKRIDELSEKEKVVKVLLASGERDYAHAIGESLSDQPFTWYRGSLSGDKLKGVFSLQWLKDKKVRGFFYPEGAIAEYKIYGFNHQNGRIKLQVFKGKKLFGSGELVKSKVGKGLQWSGELSDSRKNYRATLEKISLSGDSRGNESEYVMFSGYPRKKLKLTFGKNDYVSAYLEHGRNSDGSEYFFSGINYRKGWMFLEESGNFGDNESIVGARCLLRKQLVNGGVVWQGYRFTSNGDISEVAFGRKIK